MKKITIPIQFGYPAVKVCINDIEYICLTGKEIEVEDCVAELFESMQHKIPKPAPIVPPFIPGGGSGGGSAVIEPLNITENGTYEAPEGVDGYSPVVVNVAGGGEKILYMDAALLNAGGAYPVDADDYTTAVIPAGVTFLDAEAFENLPNIDTVIILCDCEFESHSEYDDNTKSTTYYNAITKNGIPIRTFIAPGLAEIPGGFMKGVATLVEVVASGSVGNQAFAGCTCLERVTLINCSTIGATAFYGCAFAKFTIPEGVTSIDVTAFSGCSNLTEITIPSSVTYIGRSAFFNCSKLSEVTLPDGLTSIDTLTFKNCTALTKVTIPSSVTYIDAQAFEGCTALATIRGYAGSAAETFANENGYTFEVIE